MTICSGHGFKQLEAGDEEDLEQRPGEAPAIGAQIGQEFPGEIAHGRVLVSGARGASTACAAPPGVDRRQLGCFATVSMMRCISRPNSTVR